MSEFIPVYENRVNLVGYIDKVKVFESEGKKTFIQMTLLTINRFTDKDGKWVHKKSWHHLKLFGDVINVVRPKDREYDESYQSLAQEGEALAIEGALGYDEWETPAGESKKSAVIYVKKAYRILDPRMQDWLDDDRENHNNFMN